MKKTLILLATGLLVLGACSKNVTVKNPITISSPTPTVAITKVDLNVTLKVTDALLVNNEFPLLPAFRTKVQNAYYAAVDNMDFSDPAQVAARINDWARRNTNGFIDKILEEGEISASAAAFLMNALYFKARWEGPKL